MLRSLHLDTRGLWVFDHWGFWRLGSAVYAELAGLDHAGGDSVEAGNVLVPDLDLPLLSHCRCLLIMLF